MSVVLINQDILVPTGQIEYITSGSYFFTVPSGVFSISVVCVAGGGGGGYGAGYGGGGSGGNLRYVNNIPVTPGDVYSVIVGAGGLAGTDTLTPGTDGGDSSFGASLVVAKGGRGGYNYAGLPNSVGNIGTGGNGGSGGYPGDGGGGGAGGYSSLGGNGGYDFTYQPTGGGGGGGGGGGSGYGAAGGGGVGLKGQGPSGSPGYTPMSYGENIYQGGGGSGGIGYGYKPAGYDPLIQSGGLYGGGGGGGWGGGNGASGGVRIIWPGNKRYFPNSSTGDI